MINKTLYVREMKKSIKMLLIFAAVITMYVTIIIGMYDPEMMEMLKGFEEMMPELMAAGGMTTGATSLLGFMVSYLYGFIFLIFPMIYCILRGNGLVSKYIDIQADLLEMNAHELENNDSIETIDDKKQVIKKQLAIAAAFRKVADKIAVEANKSEREATKEIKADTRKYKIDEVETDPTVGPSGGSLF